MEALDNARSALLFAADQFDQVNEKFASYLRFWEKAIGLGVPIETGLPSLKLASLIIEAEKKKSWDHHVIDGRDLWISRHIQQLANGAAGKEVRNTVPPDTDIVYEATTA